MPLLRLRLVRPAMLVDLRHVDSLATVALDGGLSLGAMVRQRELERHPGIGEGWPLLRAAVQFVGHVAIRNVGTVGGSLAHGDPSAELLAAAVALDATVEAVSVRGRRWIPAGAFVRSYLTTTLEPDELLAAVHFPPRPASEGWAFHEVARRPGDFALVTVACLVRLAARERIASVRVVVGGCGPAPVRVEAVEEMLRGAEPQPGAFAEAGRLVPNAIDPPSDIHATAAYRRHAAAGLTERALAEACRRAEARAA
jgi:CO/xanthine dehydrogenase FAD-binding subunit